MEGSSVRSGPRGGRLWFFAIVKVIQSTYYDELGLERNATPAQIRDSYRALARLLHPDQHLDPELKAAAERQMRRINGIYAVLSDAERRRRYDAENDDDPVRTFSSLVDPKRFAARFLWAGAIVILAGACLWLYVGSDHAPPAIGAAPVANIGQAPIQPSAPSGRESRQIEALRSELRGAREERDTAKHELNRVRALLETRNRRFMEPPRAGPAPVVPAAAEPAPEFRVDPALPRSPAAALPKTPGSEAHPFAGFWFFAPGGERTGKNLYPPQFIEAILTEHNGVIHGRYRARYRIVDRAISPDVNFEFTGTAAGPNLTAPWTGSGGAKGQVVLSLTSENSLKFDWTATELGTAQGLASGTATLMRRIE